MLCHQLTLFPAKNIATIMPTFKTMLEKVSKYPLEWLKNLTSQRERRSFNTSRHS